jgi:hypothetical protein
MVLVAGTADLPVAIANLLVAALDLDAVDFVLRDVLF